MAQIGRKGGHAVSTDLVHWLPVAVEALARAREETTRPLRALAAPAVAAAYLASRGTAD